MKQSTIKRILLLCGGLIALWAAIEYLLPIALPFLLGGLLAWGAEPLVRTTGNRLKLPRFVASGIGVTLTIVLTGALICILGALIFRELMSLAADLPDIRQTAAGGTAQLEGFLLNLADKTPKNIRPVLTSTVETAFDDTSALMEQVTRRLSTSVTGTISRVPRFFFTFGTAIIAAFMISGRLPKLKTGISQKLPESWHQRYIPALMQIKNALLKWLQAQMKLALITWLIVGTGFVILKVPYGILWAALVAIVDAVPILGTGTALIPWAVVEFLQDNPGKGSFLLILYGIAMVSRTIFEPRLVGQHLGLDPLVTLAAFYTGYVLWGFWGMLLSPILATALKAALRPQEKPGFSP